MGNLRTVTGTVVSDKSDKTIVVEIKTSKTHPVYKKRYTVTNKFHAHDEKNQAKIGDEVEIKECIPKSKKKCWEMTQITKVNPLLEAEIN